MPAELKALAQTYAPDALKTLSQIMRDEGAPQAARVSAANALLDRGYGKPVQQNEIGGIDGLPIRYEFTVKRAGSEVNGD